MSATRPKIMTLGETIVAMFKQLNKELEDAEKPIRLPPSIKEQREQAKRAKYICDTIDETQEWD